MMNSSQGWVTSLAVLWRIGMITQQRKQKPKEKLYLELNFAEKPFVPFEVVILATEDFACIHRSRPLSPERADGGGFGRSLPTINDAGKPVTRKPWSGSPTLKHDSGL